MHSGATEARTGAGNTSNQRLTQRVKLFLSTIITLGCFGNRGAPAPNGVPTESDEIELTTSPIRPAGNPHWGVGPVNAYLPAPGLDGRAESLAEAGPPMGLACLGRLGALVARMLQFPIRSSTWLLFGPTPTEVEDGADSVIIPARDVEAGIAGNGRRPARQEKKSISETILALNASALGTLMITEAFAGTHISLKLEILTVVLVIGSFASLIAVLLPEKKEEKFGAGLGKLGALCFSCAMVFWVGTVLHVQPWAWVILGVLGLIPVRVIVISKKF